MNAVSPLAARVAVLAGLCLFGAACSTATKTAGSKAWVDPRLDVDLPVAVADAAALPKGGGRYQVGKPYQIAGKWYEPKEDPNYDRSGVASWYGPSFHGRLTANGEIFDRAALTAAHPTLPLPSYVRVTNLSNDRSIIVRVNDRGPFSHTRLIDVSERTAELLDFKRRGMAQVRVEYVDRAKLDGRDESFLMASYSGPIGKPGVMLASASAPASARFPAPRRRAERVEVAAVADTARQPRPREIAFVADAPADAAALPSGEAVDALTSPFSPDARILMAFDTASVPQ